jgi:hypothetical protein
MCVYQYSQLCANILSSDRFKARWEPYLLSALKTSNCDFFIYGSCMNLNENMDYFLKQR